MLEIIQEAATRLVQDVLTPELKEEVIYLLDNCQDDYDKKEMNVIIDKLLSNIEETIATLECSLGANGSLRLSEEKT